MSGRGIALLVIAALAVLSAAGLAGAAAIAARNVPWELTALVAAPSAACGGCALSGLAWWLSGAMVP